MTAGSTLIKAVHFTELRAAADPLLAMNGRRPRMNRPNTDPLGAPGPSGQAPDRADPGISGRQLAAIMELI